MSFKRVALGCLFTIVLLIAGGVGTVYYLVMHTSLPLAAVQGMLDQGEGMRVKGLGGTLASGFHVESIEFPGEGGKTSVIEDVRFDYSGPWDLFMNQRLVIQEFSVGKAHLYILARSGSETLSPSSRSSGKSKTAKDGNGGLKLFRIDRICLKNLLLEDPAAEFRLEIPEASWCGLRVEGDEVDLGTVKIDSDRIDLNSSGTLTSQQGGWKITLPESLEGTLKPLMHKAIRWPIDFVCRFVSGDAGKLGYHLAALQGTLRIDIDPDGAAKLHAADLDLDAALELAPYGLPKDVNLKAELKPITDSDGTAEKSRLEIRGGDFTLGVAKFQIEPMTLEAAKDERPEIAIRSVCRKGDEVIVLDTTLITASGRIVQRLSAEPALPPRDVVAKVFFGKPYGELSAEGQAAIDVKVPIYTPEAEALNPEP